MGNYCFSDDTVPTPEETAVISRDFPLAQTTYVNVDRFQPMPPTSSATSSTGETKVDHNPNRQGGHVIHGWLWEVLSEHYTMIAEDKRPGAETRRTHRINCIIYEFMQRECSVQQCENM